MIILRQYQQTKEAVMLSVHPQIKKEVLKLEAYTDYLNYDEQEARAELKEIEAIEKDLKNSKERN
jgi:hypothetical protein